MTTSNGPKLGNNFGASDVGSPGRSMREWATKCVQDSRFMRSEVERLRHEYGRPKSKQDRLLRDWFCSERGIRDEADPCSRFDHPTEHDYGGGSPVLHPYFGPREIQEIAREILRGLRLAVKEHFPSYRELQAVYYGRVAQSIIEKPAEQWTEDWVESDWIAWLYVSGTRSLKSAVGALDHHWVHAVVMLHSAEDALLAIHVEALREERFRAERRILEEEEKKRKHTAPARIARAERASSETSTSARARKRLEAMLKNGQPIDARDVASRIADEIGCSPRHVRDVRKAMLKSKQGR